MYVFLFLATPLGSSPRGYSGFRVTGMIEGFLFGLEFSILGFSFAGEGGRGRGEEYPHPPNQVNRIKIFLFVALSTESF